MTFTLPAAFREPAGAAVVPFTFEGQTPQVHGEIDGPGRPIVTMSSKRILRRSVSLSVSSTIRSVMLIRSNTTLSP